MSINHLTISGKILRCKRFRSPAGIGHCVMLVEHQSQRVQDDMTRQVFCRIQVILTGKRFESVAEELTLSMDIKVEGFIAQQQQRNGQSRLVLHAEHIELRT